MEKELLKMDGAIDIKDIDMELPPQGWFAGLGIGLIFDKEKMKLLLEEMLLRVGVKILYMTDIVDVFKDENEIKGVIVHNKSGLYGIEGKYFVDATGDGWDMPNPKKAKRPAFPYGGKKIAHNTNSIRLSFAARHK